MNWHEKETFAVAEELTAFCSKLAEEKDFTQEELAEVITFFLAFVGTSAGIAGASAEFQDCAVKWKVDDFEEDAKA